VQILERLQALRPSNVRSRLEQPGRLWLNTENVRRMRIERGRLDLTARGSLSLQVDGQSFEWLASAPVLELERSAGGYWTARGIGAKTEVQRRK
jgi:hypothetical protein